MIVHQTIGSYRGTSKSSKLRWDRPKDLIKVHSNRKAGSRTEMACKSQDVVDEGSNFAFLQSKVIYYEYI